MRQKNPGIEIKAKMPKTQSKEGVGSIIKYIWNKQKKMEWICLQTANDSNFPWYCTQQSTYSHPYKYDKEIAHMNEPKTPKKKLRNYN